MERNGNDRIEAALADSFVVEVRNQPRITSHVKHATPSGTIPTSRFFPSQGSTIKSCLAILLNPPLAKIQPACRPMGSQSDRVFKRASAKIQPIKNKVVNPAATRI